MRILYSFVPVIAPRSGLTLTSLALFSVLYFPLKAQSTDTLRTQRVFQLGEVTITAFRSADTLNSLPSETVARYNRLDVSNALNLMPGVSLANVGPRKESVVYVRGFDLRQVPVFIDGVPVYVPYDGYVDLGRFTTFDLSQISVAKGFASILYGANTMGGAINLVSRKPVKRFEYDARAGVFSGQGLRGNLNIGSNFGKFYMQAGASVLTQDTYPLPKDFNAVQYEDGGDRQNAYRDDLKFSAKVGFTPRESDEYVIGYSVQHGEKGTPPYIGTDQNIRTRFWQWPKWNKQSLYAVSNTAIGTQHRLKGRLFYDTFVNELVSYDDETYSAITRPFAFRSFYNDYSVGGNVEFESRALKNNVLNVSIQAKYDVHRENNLGEPQRTFSDNTVSVGIEDTWRIVPAVALVPGISYNARISGKAQDYNATTQEITDFASNTNDAINAQIGVLWDINTSHMVQGTVARKTRFATIKDRYSYRMGAAIPNPDLAAEFAVNYDLTYTGRLPANLTVQASVFRSNISDIIQQVDNVQPMRFQLQNAGNAVFYGTDMQASWNPARGIQLNVNYSYIRRQNETNPEIHFTNVPDHKVFGSADYTFLERFRIMASAERNSKRYSTSYGTSVPGYTLVNTMAGVKIIKGISFEGGVNNLFDQAYSLVEGFPEAGRNFFVTLHVTNL